MGVWDQPGDVDLGLSADQAWSHPLARLMYVDERGWFAASCEGVEPPGDLRHDDLYVGMSGGVPWFARPAGRLREAEDPRQAHWSPAQRQRVTRAQALFNWHRTAPHCDRCGQATVPVTGGRVRRCAACGGECFPRTDPAVIVAVVDGSDRLLLAHQSSWSAGRVSVLAGFVEAGESAEHAVYREVAEESGVLIDQVTFYGTQPWPYPRSLMIAFVASTRATEIVVDGVELAWARFFARDGLLAAVAAGEVLLPGQSSIASRMIEDWLAGALSVPRK